MKIKNFLKFALTPLLFVVLSLGANLCLVNTSGFSLDKLAYQISDYNNPYKSEEAAYMNIKATNKEDQNKQFTDLMENFYYSNMTYCVRQYCDNDIQYDYGDGQNIPLTLHIQSTHSIREKEEPKGGYYLDKGLFYTYYSDSILAPGTTRDIRFGCDSFIFISDKFADKLVSKYHLETKEDPYKELITNKDYCVLPVLMDQKTEIKLCINNILYSDKRTGPRVSTFNENFGTAYLFGDFKKNAVLKFEFDFKPSPFCITSLLKQCTGMGYDKTIYDYKFFAFDQTSKQYVYNQDITEQYNRITSSFDVMMFVAFIIILVAGTFGFYWLIEKWGFDKGHALLTFIILFSLIFIYSLVTTFIYTYSLFAICPMYFMLVYLILRWKELTNCARQIVFTEHKR